MKKEVSNDPPPHISIDSEYIQVDTTKVIVDIIEDPFKDNGLVIFCNIVDYSSSIDEDKEEEVKINAETKKKEEDTVAKKDVGEVRVSTNAETSIPIVTTTPSTPPTLVVVTSTSALLGDGIDHRV